jgi:hypothetical protein
MHEQPSHFSSSLILVAKLRVKTNGYLFHMIHYFQSPFMLYCTRDHFMPEDFVNLPIMHKVGFSFSCPNLGGELPNRMTRVSALTDKFTKFECSIRALQVADSHTLRRIAFGHDGTFRHGHPHGRRSKYYSPAYSLSSNHVISRILR